jgi:Ubiquitin-conjugating enzyme
MALSAAQLRRQSDRELLERLAARSNGLLTVRSFKPDRIECRTFLPTNCDQDYPHARNAHTDFVVQLALRYPFEAPKVFMQTKVWHPNVFSNNIVCLGTQWHVGEGMDLFVARVVRLLTYDPLLLNLDSPANSAAARWYERNPNNALFPTITRSDHAWLFDPRAEKIVLTCPSCKAQLRLPSNQSGTIVCPQCQHEFFART